MEHQLGSHTERDSETGNGSSISCVYMERLSQFPSRFLLSRLGNPRYKHTKPIQQPACKPVCKPLPGGSLKPGPMRFRCACDVCKR